MERARVFHCGVCGKRVIVCRRCDRGQRYCCRACAQEARRASIRWAGWRYRRSQAGQLGNARRQRALYLRRHLPEKNLTHQGSQDLPSCGTIAPEPAGALAPAVASEAWRSNHCAEEESARVARCDFCGRPCLV